ncbi:Uncharacterized conserved protein YjiS, DUF1127 family [Pseudomonas arsenicoxydans]|uniref:Uncharacterized conserved protein YjiS, DUF1127 family n=1 Tax=Pseudomonas arsenicoxydans TaxID=702115 RepID=A0A1H0D8R5_9PSED|nr:DUF1127 domain-containing protein [Pseudomonas arsenicoxydans]SDN66356.1 Uncharacterized conserved protein YjiS, DUF1127 family [Pseudomonas arsenicoxydans]
MEDFQSDCAPALQSKLQLRRLKGLLTAFAGSLERARTRRLLGQMNEHQLSDLGISHADRLNELDKPFWR